MKLRRKIALCFLAVMAVGVLTFAVPFTERLHGPKVAKLAPTPAGVDVGVAVSWYDRGLNRERFHRQLPFGSDGTITLPAYDIPTSLGRAILKRLLTRFDAWTACTHCYGPTASCSLFQRSGYQPPEKLRLVQNSTTIEDTVTFAVSLIPDESKYEPRPFSPTDVEALIAEVRTLTTKGNSPFVEPLLFGPYLRQVNPVRAESYHGALVLWMGGKSG
jgi:hypothetical protein